MAECGLPHGAGTELQLATRARRGHRERERAGALVPRRPRSHPHCYLQTLPFTGFSQTWGSFLRSEAISHLMSLLRECKRSR